MNQISRKHKVLAERSPRRQVPERAWRCELPFGLPDNFDFRNIETVEDASSFILALPNAHRGIGAKRLFEHRDIVGKPVAYQGLLQAWNHDHRHVRLAFGSDLEFVSALREVSPPMKFEEPITAYRGVDHIEAAAGAAWTTNRDTARWFACRSQNGTPFVLTHVFQPEDIVARCDARGEHELIVDPSCFEFDSIMLDDGSDSYACDITCYEDVWPTGIMDWQAGAVRYAEFVKSENDRRIKAARHKSRKSEEQQQ